MICLDYDDDHDSNDATNATTSSRTWDESQSLACGHVCI